MVTTSFANGYANLTSGMRVVVENAKVTYQRSVARYNQDVAQYGKLTANRLRAEAEASYRRVIYQVSQGTLNVLQKGAR